MHIRNTLIFSLILLYSCTSSTNQVQKSYENELSQFPKFVIDFFPSNITTPYAISKNIDTTSNCIYYQLYLFNADVSQLNHRYIASYKPDDKQLITIKRNILFEWDKAEKIYYNSIQKNQKTYYPIIYFEEINLLAEMNQKLIFSSNSESGLGPNFSIRVYDSKPGIFWKGLKPQDYMPVDWKNGYSKGVCISDKDKVVIYWFVIW